MPNANHICFLCIQINGHRSVAPSLPKIFKTIPTFACRQRTPLHFICVMNTWRWLCVVLLWSYRECYVHLAHFRSTTTMQFSKERFTAPSSFGCWVTSLPPLCLCTEIRAQFNVSKRCPEQNSFCELRKLKRSMHTGPVCHEVHHGMWTRRHSLLYQMQHVVQCNAD